MSDNEFCPIAAFYLWAPLDNCGFTREISLVYVNPSNRQADWVDPETGITGAANQGKYIWIGNYPVIEVGAQSGVNIHSVSGEDIAAICGIGGGPDGNRPFTYQPVTETRGDFAGVEVSCLWFNENIGLQGINVVGGP